VPWEDEEGDDTFLPPLPQEDRLWRHPAEVAAAERARSPITTTTTMRTPWRQALVLAAIGVTNTMLIQVRARQREFAVLRTVGMDRWQVLRMLLLEGLLIGTVSALLALIIGSLLAVVSVVFLDRFTLFEYHFSFSWRDTFWISALALVTCCISAIYPALGATKVSAAESLHYE